jgi:hypothetical protein
MMVAPMGELTIMNNYISIERGDETSHILIFCELREYLKYGMGDLDVLIVIGSNSIDQVLVDRVCSLMDEKPGIMRIKREQDEPVSREFVFK